MTALLTRLGFAFRYRTLKKVTVLPGDPEKVVACHNGSIAIFRRFCPHQGAPLETGYFDHDALLCPWHGCRFPVKK